MNNIIFLWFAIGIFFIILEMGMPTLFLFLSFAIGAAIAGFSSLFIDSLVIQSTFFLIGTALALLVLRLWLKQQAKEEVIAIVKTNIDALRGKHGVVLKTISLKNSGVVKIGGEVWTARTYQNVVIPVGAEVEIIDIIGAHVIVIPLER